MHPFKYYHMHDFRPNCTPSQFNYHYELKITCLISSEQCDTDLPSCSAWSLPNKSDLIQWPITLECDYSGTSILQRVKGLAKYVRYSEVLLYQGTFPYILLLLGWRISFVIPRTLSYKSFLYQSCTVLISNK